MPKKCGTTKKCKTKKSKCVTNPKSRKNKEKNISSISVSSTSVLDYTLPEDNHLDSFDRFLANSKSKPLPNLQKKIRPTFNRDSSVEYSSDASTQSNEQSSENHQEMEIEVIQRTPEAKNGNSEEPQENIDPRAGRKSYQFGCSINSSNSWMFDRSTREKRRKKKAALAENTVPSEKNTLSKRRKKCQGNIGTKLKKGNKNSSLIVSSTPVQRRKAIRKTSVDESPIFPPIDFNAIKWPEKNVETPIIKTGTASHSTPIPDKIPPNTPIINLTTDKMIADDNNGHSLDKGFLDDGLSFVILELPEDNDKDDTFERRRQTTIESIVTINETHEMENTKEEICTPISISKRVSIRRRPNNFGTKLTYSHKRNGESDSPIVNQSKAFYVKANSDLNRTRSSKLFELTNPTGQSTTCSNESSHLIISVQNDNNINGSVNVIDSRSNESSTELEGSCSVKRTTASNRPKLSEMPTANESLSEEEESSNQSMSGTEETSNESLDEGNEESINESNEANNLRLIDRQFSNQSTFNSTSVNNHSDVAVFVPSTRSGDHSTASRNTATAENQSPKISSKPRVGFDDVNLAHELSNNLQSPKASHDSMKIVMKGGKWRRTIYDNRKSKLTNFLRATIEKESAKECLPKTSVRSSRAFVISRKSILVKDIPDRRTAEITRKPSQNLAVLDESDAESICSSDFSPRPRSINVLSKLRSGRLLQPIGDCIDFEKRRSQSQYNRKTAGHHHLSICSTSSTDSVVDDLEDLTSSLNLGYDQQELKAQILKRCGQTKVLPFDDVYSARNLKNCRKIGEGVFGEVFLNEISPRSSYVLKIIPIEGVEEINGAQQKRFHEILQEIIISQELSGLRYGKTNSSSGFVEVLNVRLVEGRYPNHLLNLWHDYYICDQTENDCPDVFGDDQLYVVFELANCGLDLEANIFKNAQQSFSAFKQVALSLAVAESEYQFEHRDLHWGNVLVSPTADKFITYYLNGKSIEIPTHGVKATIIDYTLSRLVYKNQCLFQDLAADPELFEANGDYQYDIYRLMRTQTNNYWEVFEPYTNVLWLHYIADKMIDGIRYSSRRAVKHRQAIDDMMKLRDVLLEFRSATDYVESDH